MHGDPSFEPAGSPDPNRALTPGRSSPLRGAPLCRSGSTDLPSLIASDGLFYFLRRGIGIKKTTSDEGKSSFGWLKISKSKMGKICTPLVIAQSHLFFGSSKGLVCVKSKE